MSDNSEHDEQDESSEQPGTPLPKADDDADAEHEVAIEDLVRLNRWAEQLTRSRAFQEFARRNQQQWASLFRQSAAFQKSVSRNKQRWAKLARSFDVPTSSPLLLAKMAEAFQPERAAVGGPQLNRR